MKPAPPVTKMHFMGGLDVCYPTSPVSIKSSLIAPTAKAKSGEGARKLNLARGSSARVFIADVEPAARCASSNKSEKLQPVLERRSGSAHLDTLKAGVQELLDFGVLSHVIGHVERDWLTIRQQRIDLTISVIEPAFRALCVGRGRKNLAKDRSISTSLPRNCAAIRCRPPIVPRQDQDLCSR